MVRTMLSAAHLPATLWAEALNTAVYARNRSPSRVKVTTAHEAWTGHPPSISHMKPFGCSAHVLIPSTHRQHKWAGKSFPGIMVGYAQQSKAYRILKPSTMEIFITRNVKFNESTFPGPDQSVSSDLDFNFELMSPVATEGSDYPAIDLAGSDVIPTAPAPRDALVPDTPQEPMNIDPGDAPSTTFPAELPTSSVELHSLPSDRPLTRLNRPYPPSPIPDATCPTPKVIF
ncbi:hypothetical protein V1522DRAFT_395473 [Lipomyces starkeyi]